MGRHLLGTSAPLWLFAFLPLILVQPPGRNGQVAAAEGTVAPQDVAYESGGDRDSPRSISGIYPHLAMFNEEDECGTGAVVPWAGRMWVITYAPHKPLGSTDKLYEITPLLEQIIRPESIGGTPANRMIHRESHQLFIGPYAIDARRNVRVISYEQMFGRPTGNARHLTDPENKLYYATMEEGLYEVDVHTLAVTELWADEHLKRDPRWQGLARKDARFADLPGYHGKGLYSGQGWLVYANNGEHGAEAQRRPDVPSGVLAQWDGRAEDWTVLRRNQFTEVTGPGGIQGSSHPATDPIWSVGWDHRSLILMVLDRGQWHAYRLPKASHTYDGAHGWNTEWPRIRDIGEEDLLMTMHGSFWRFPRTFSAADSAGLSPRSTYLKVIGDFCRWGDRVVLGCDDTARSEFLNKHPLKGDLAGPGQSQSNLWFVEPARLDQCGPPLGRGAVWLEDDVQAGRCILRLFVSFACLVAFAASASCRRVSGHVRAGSGCARRRHLVNAAPRYCSGAVCRPRLFHGGRNRRLGAAYRPERRGPGDRIFPRSRTGRSRLPSCRHL